MSRISDILQSLNKEDYNALMLAFQAQTTYVVKLDDNVFIGVNVQDSPNLVTTTKEGFWSYGYTR